MQILTLMSAVVFGLTRPVCSIAVNPFSPGPGETYFGGVFSDGMVEVPPGDHPLGKEPGHWSNPDSGSAVYGQVVYIGEVAGHRSSEVRRKARDGGRIRAVVVLWDYDAGCAPTRFGNGTPWGVAGDSAYFRATLRDRSAWVGDTPTFDVYWAGETIYPFSATRHGRDLLRGHSEVGKAKHGAKEKKQLTPVEAFRLVRSLPATCDYVRNHLVARIRLRWVLWRWKKFADYAPADRIFEYHRHLRDGENRYLEARCDAKGSNSSLIPPTERTSDDGALTPRTHSRSSPLLVVAHPATCRFFGARVPPIVNGA